MAARVLLLADTHVGFDLPTRPRVRRRRRGLDFLTSYQTALAPALSGDVDLVVHGGDVFHRARVPPSLVYQAFEPLRAVADAGVPVVVVPGNHERSRIPHARFAAHPRIHVFDRARTFVVDVGTHRIALSGFPYERRRVRDRFPALLHATGFRDAEADLSVLCVHHCFEGATVGPQEFTFRGASDVIRVRDVPNCFAAVLTGHIHRHQVLTRDLCGRELPVPVLYPGSVERTAFAEKDEAKGYVILDLDLGGEGGGGRLVGWRFVELPARPMLVRKIAVQGMPGSAVESLVRDVLGSVPPDAVLRLEIHGQVLEGARPSLSAGRLRAVAPREMNVDAVLVDEPRRPGFRSSGDSRRLGSTRTGRRVGR
jgi:DNA repair exonuclease SbcCD nuclease subunit